MKKTPVSIERTELINYQNSVCFLGSCFSEHLSKKMTNTGFRVNSNPFGVLFNPLSISSFLTGLNNNDWEKNIVQSSDLFFSWEANSTLYSRSEEGLNKLLRENAQSFRNELENASVLFITFGSAWVYRLSESNKVVANCHKMAANLFQRELLSIEQIIKQWTEVLSDLRNSFPNLKIVFTLSPVRHTREGMVDNARSKAVLLESIHQIIEGNNDCYYFPAYEIVMDELRDYGYFGKDGIHPNEVAVDQIWERFKNTFLDDETLRISIEYSKLKQAFDHRLLHPESLEGKKFISGRNDKLELYKKKHPFPLWENINNSF